MAAIKTVAEADGWFYILTDFDDLDLDALSVADITSGIEGSWDAAASNTRFSFTPSDTIDDRAYGEGSNAQAVGRSNYEGSIAPYIKQDPETGQYDLTANPIFEAVRIKGTRLLVVAGVTGDPLADRTAGELYDAFVYTTDNPQRPTDVGGYRKVNVPLLPAGRAVSSRALVSGA